MLYDVFLIVADVSRWHKLKAHTIIKLVQKGKSTPYLSTTCTTITAHPTPKRTQIQTYIKI